MLQSENTAQLLAQCLCIRSLQAVHIDTSKFTYQSNPEFLECKNSTLQSSSTLECRVHSRTLECRVLDCSGLV